MSVTMSRFVNVMSGGKFGKNWAEKPMHKSDAKTLARLDAMQAALDKHLPVLAPEPKLQALQQGLWNALQQTEGRKGAKLLEYLDGVATKVGQGLKLAEAHAANTEATVAAWHASLDTVQTRLRLFDGDMANDTKIDAKLKRALAASADSVRQELFLLEAGLPFATLAALQDGIKRLEADKEDLRLLEKARMRKLPLETTQQAAATMQKARAEPDSSLGKIVGLTETYAEDYLLNLAQRKLEDKTDFSGLADDELLAIHVYSAMAAYYTRINAVLLGIDRLDPKQRDQVLATIETCKRGLAKLPDYPAQAWPTYRFEDGSKYDWESQFKVGTTFKNKIFWSTGRSGGFDAAGIKGPRLEIVIYGKKAGKDIARMAEHDDEGGGEILIPPGTTFKTLSIDLDKDLDPAQNKLVTKAAYIVVEEV